MNEAYRAMILHEHIIQNIQSYNFEVHIFFIIHMLKAANNAYVLSQTNVFAIISVS